MHVSTRSGDSTKDRTRRGRRCSRQALLNFRAPHSTARTRTHLPAAPDVVLWSAAQLQRCCSRLHTRKRTPEPHPTLSLAYRIYGAPNNSVDPATGQPLFSPMINRTRGRGQRRRRSNTVAAAGGGGGGATNTRDDWFFRSPRADVDGEEGGGGGDGSTAENDDDRLPIHVSLWQRGRELERRREAGARAREEARRSRASAGHVNGKSAELIRAMRVRSLVQTYRTLLASVEYARLPDGLDYDEVSI